MEGVNYSDNSLVFKDTYTELLHALTTECLHIRRGIAMSCTLSQGCLKAGYRHTSKKCLSLFSLTQYSGMRQYCSAQVLSSGEEGANGERIVALSPRQ